MLIAKRQTKTDTSTQANTIPKTRRFFSDKEYFKNVEINNKLNSKLKEVIFSNSTLLKELKKFKPSQVASILSRSSSESREQIYKRCISLLK